jgi:outer membrane protein OmpU
MKKVLLATSILAATTGFAAAEVATSGSARMGVYFDGSDAYFTSRVRVSFAMSGESDSGLSFGASIRADQAGIGNGGDGTGTAAPGDDMSAGSVYVKGAFGTLTFGDNDSASNALVGNVSGVGLTGLGDMNELGYLGQTDTSALYQYEAGALSFALSSSQLQAADEAVSVAVKYTTDAFAVALGYEDTAADEQITLGASGTFGGATLKLVAADRDSWADTHFAVSADYAMNATNVTVYFADHGGTSAYGLGASHDLGGGLSLVGGVAKMEGVDAIADFGLSMSF